MFPTEYLPDTYSILSKIWITQTQTDAITGSLTTDA
jgi:hypothetical protein